MEYLKEINAFYDWVRSDARVKSSAISLWHGLMNIANKAGWPTEITVSISTLQSTTGMGKNSIYAARNILQQVGRIQFKERKGSQSAKYTIIPFAFEIRTQTGTQSSTQTMTQTGTQSGTQPGNIYRLEETRLDKTENNISSPTPPSNNPKNKPEPKRKLGEYKHVRLTDKQVEKLKADLGEDTYLACLKVLDEYCQTSGRSYQDYNLVMRGWVLERVQEEQKKAKKLKREAEKKRTDYSLIYKKNASKQEDYGND